MNKYSYIILAILAVSCGKSGSGSLADMIHSSSVQWSSYKGNFSRNPAYGHSLALPLEKAWQEDASRSIGSTPLVLDNRLIVHARDRRMIALDRHSGKRLWREVYKGAFSVSSAIIVDGLLVFASQRPDGRLIVFNPENRKDILIENLGPSTATPIFHNGRIFFFNQYGKVIKFDHTEEKMEWETGLDGRLEYNPVVIGNRLIASTIENNLYSIDTENGSILKRISLDALILGDLTSDGTSVYLNLDDGRTVKLSADSLETLWSAKPADSYFSGPVFNEGYIYACSRRGELIKLSAADGSEIWRQSLGGPSVCSPVVHDNIVFAATKSGDILAVGNRDGKILWQDTLDEGISATPLIYDGYLYVCTDRGRVHAYKSSE